MRLHSPFPLVASTRCSAAHSCGTHSGCRQGYAEWESYLLRPTGYSRRGTHTGTQGYSHGYSYAEWESYLLRPTGYPRSSTEHVARCILHRTLARCTLLHRCDDGMYAALDFVGFRCRASGCGRNFKAKRTHRSTDGMNCMVSTKWSYLQCRARLNPLRAEQSGGQQRDETTTSIVAHFPGAPCIAACACTAEPTLTSVSERAAGDGIPHEASNRMSDATRSSSAIATKRSCSSCDRKSSRIDTPGTPVSTRL